MNNFIGILLILVMVIFIIYFSVPRRENYSKIGITSCNNLGILKDGNCICNDSNMIGDSFTLENIFYPTDNTNLNWSDYRNLPCTLNKDSTLYCFNKSDALYSCNTYTLNDFNQPGNDIGQYDCLTNMTNCDNFGLYLYEQQN